MTTPYRLILRPKLVAACVAACFATAAPALCANTVAVTRCDDNNIAGDLRHGIAAAVNNGDTVDMSALTNCPNSTISLQLGELSTSHDITLLGPGKDKLLISGKYNLPQRILDHGGTGTLTIKNLTVGLGYAVVAGSSGFPPAIITGGCIYSNGSVSLDHADVGGCTAKVSGGAGIAAGGGIFAAHDLTLTYSALVVNSTIGTLAIGGGALVYGNVSADHSSVVSNYATGDSTGYAGGLLVNGNATITSSTIAANIASDYFGGIMMKGSTGSLQITNSTISGNSALRKQGGGIGSSKPSTTIRNSTIAFNHAATGSSGSYSPGLAIVASSGSVNLQSTLIANNTYGTPAIENDVSATNLSVPFIGGNNLVPVATVSLPNGTITGACPLLGPLRDNGGPTRTHALLSHSRGIDEGNNSAALANDQRGPPYVRVSNGIADIGAYEVQKDEIVFDAGFDGCP